MTSSLESSYHSRDAAEFGVCFEVSFLSNFSVKLEQSATISQNIPKQRDIFEL